MMTPRSSTLFHFTKSRETLKLILAGGFWPRYCVEDIRWVGQADAPTIAFPMVCFCDIPLSRISDHVNFYGQYGLGMTREWATANSLNPVLYIAGENPICSELRALNRHTNKLVGNDKVEAKDSLRYLYAHTKPSRGVMVVDGTPVEKDFYLESEWRHVPKAPELTAYLRADVFEDPDKLIIENKKTDEHCRLKFTPRDVKYIFVKSDADIPELINFIQADMDHLPHSETKVLMSRITSLESIQEDV
jgi:Putative abortive phage resistance protein AbiGi, antitoxin